MAAVNQTYNFNYPNMNFGQSMLYGLFGSLTGGMGMMGMGGSIFSPMGMGCYGGFGGYGMGCYSDQMLGMQIGSILVNTGVMAASNYFDGRGGTSNKTKVANYETNIKTINDKISSQLDILGGAYTESNYKTATVEEKYTAATTEATKNYNDANNYLTNNKAAYDAAKAKKNKNETLTETEANIINNYEEYSKKIDELRKAKETAETNEKNRKKAINDAKEEINNLISERKEAEEAIEKIKLEKADGNSLQRVSKEKYESLFNNGELKSDAKVSKRTVRYAILGFKNATTKEEKLKYGKEMLALCTELDENDLSSDMKSAKTIIQNYVDNNQ